MMNPITAVVVGPDVAAGWAAPVGSVGAPLIKFMRTVLLTTLVATVVGVTPVGATSDNPAWQTGQIVQLPTGATGLSQGYLPALSCPSAGNCVAAGAYSDASGVVQALIATETAGQWANPRRLAPPSDAATAANLTIVSLSCASMNECAMGGNYQDTKGDTQSFVAAKTAGVWSSAQKVILPAGAATTGQVSSVRTVSCGVARSCSAVGYYLDNTTPHARTLGFTLSDSGSTWSSARSLTLPAGANFNPFVAVGQTVCATANTCAAIGSYLDGENVARGLVMSRTGVTWSTRTLVLSANANAYPEASLSELTCVSAGNCVAIGTFISTSGAIDGLTVTETRGVWGRAHAMVMPDDAAASPHVFFYGYGGVDCSSVGNCAAGGQYRDRAGAYQGFLLNEVHGTWRPATRLTLPGGANAAGRNGGVVAVTCRTNGTCSAGAAYLDAAGHYQALLVNEVDANWLAGQKVALPGAATTVGVAGGIYAVVCHASGPCTASGSYLDTSGRYQGFTVAGN